MLTPRENPLLSKAPARPQPAARGADDEPGAGLAFDCAKLKAPHSIKGKVNTSREIKKLMRQETAREAVGDLYPQCSIFGITKGQFSLIELIETLLDQTGPADVFLSTWTAAGSDLTDAFKLIDSGKMRSFRILVDHTFQRRKPAFAAKVRELFGIEAVRVTRNHAKFCLIRNDTWDLVIKTSMNLNFNPRLEDFDIADDPRTADFLQGLMNEIFTRLKPRYLFDRFKENEERFKGL
jgi:hypothetical protein